MGKQIEPQLLHGLEKDLQFEVQVTMDWNTAIPSEWQKQKCDKHKICGPCQTIQWPFSWCCVVAQPISKLTTSVSCSEMAHFGIFAKWPCSESGNQT